MPARALSTATISFGLVSIPVKLYSAAESKAALAFNQIHKKDGARVKQQLISSRSGEVVPREEIVKGYEFAKDQYVLFEAEELKALEAAATHTIDITEFLQGRAGRAALPRQGVLPRHRQGRRPRLQAARASARRHGPRRDRQVRGARQAVPRHGAADGKRPRHGAAALSRRAARVQRGADRGRHGQARRAQARDAARRASRERRVQARELQGRSARAHAGVDPAQGRRRGHHARADCGAGAQDHRHHGSAEGEPRRRQSANPPKRPKRRKPLPNRKPRRRSAPRSRRP